MTKSTPAALLVAIGAAAALYRFHSSRALRVDNAFVLGRVVKLSAPRDGVIERIDATRLRTVQAGDPLVVLGDGQTLPAVHSANTRLREALAAQGCHFDAPPVADAVRQLRRALEARQGAAIVAGAQALVYEVQVLPGQWVRKGDPLATLVPRDPHQVQVNVLETQVQEIFVGQRVALALAGDAAKATRSGVVSAIVPATASSFSAIPRNNIDSSWVRVTQRMPVIIDVDSGDKDDVMRIGQSVEVEFLPGTRSGVKDVAAARAQGEGKTPAAQGVEDRAAEAQRAIEQEIGAAAAQAGGPGGGCSRESPNEKRRRAATGRNDG